MITTENGYRDVFDNGRSFSAEVIKLLPKYWPVKAEV
jgi:hypothetical protein